MISSRNLKSNDSWLVYLSLICIHSMEGRAFYQRHDYISVNIVNAEKMHAHLL